MNTVHFWNNQALGDESCHAERAPNTDDLNHSLIEKLEYDTNKDLTQAFYADKPVIFTTKSSV